MSIFLPPRFSPTGDTPFCEIDLSEYVFDSPRIATNRFTWCMDWSPDGMSCIVGTATDRRFFIKKVPSGGTPFDYRAAHANSANQGGCWTDQPGGNQGRRNMIGCQFSPNGNRVIGSHYNNSGNGELAEWTLPSPYTCTFEADPNDYLNVGQPVLTRNINTPGARLDSFRIAPNGIDVLGIVGSTASNRLGGWRFTDPWNILSVVYDGEAASVSPDAGNGRGMDVSPGGLCIYRKIGNTIPQFLLDGAPWKAVLNHSTPDQSKDLAPSGYTGGVNLIKINRNWLHVSPGITTTNYMYQYKRIGT